MPKSRYAGAINSGEIPILEEGMELKTIGLSHEDAQFLESRKFNRSEIAGIYNVPAHMINDLEKATFSNIEHQSLQFVQHSLGPWIVNLEQEMELSLLTEEEQEIYFIRFLVDGLLRGDIKTRWEAHTKARNIGALSANEIRELEDRNPREDEGGDKYLEPENMRVSGTNPEEKQKEKDDEQ